MICKKTEGLHIDHELAGIKKIFFFCLCQLIFHFVIIPVTMAL